MDEQPRKRSRTSSASAQIHPHPQEMPTESECAEEAAASDSTSYDDLDDYSDDEDDDYLYSQSDLEFLEDEDDYFYQGMEDDDVDPDELTYEELIALGEEVGVESRGLSDAEIIQHLRPLSISQSTLHLLVDRCVICQVEFEIGENLGALGHCHHPYHLDCITKWLRIKKSCPICNKEVSPYP